MCRLFSDSNSSFGNLKTSFRLICERKVNRTLTHIRITMMNTKTLPTLLLAVTISLYGCGDGDDSSNQPPQILDPQEPIFSSSLFSEDSATVDNPWLPLKPGTTHIYEGGAERIEVAVSHETKTIMGIESVVVVHRASPPLR